MMLYLSAGFFALFLNESLCLVDLTAKREVMNVS